jgi:addiction module RelE/StbE family toxin
MLTVKYTKTFLKRFKKFDSYFQNEIIEKIELSKDKNNHKRLEVHKLKAKYKGFNSFSVNRKDRILFEFENSKTVIFHDVGSHDIYK